MKYIFIVPLDVVVVVIVVIRKHGLPLEIVVIIILMHQISQIWIPLRLYPMISIWVFRPSFLGLYKQWCIMRQRPFEDLNQWKTTSFWSSKSLIQPLVFSHNCCIDAISCLHSTLPSFLTIKMYPPYFLFPSLAATTRAILLPLLVVCTTTMFIRTRTWLVPSFDVVKHVVSPIPSLPLSITKDMRPSMLARRVQRLPGGWLSLDIVVRITRLVYLYWLLLFASDFLVFPLTHHGSIVNPPVINYHFPCLSLTLPWHPFKPLIIKGSPMFWVVTRGCCSLWLLRRLWTWRTM